LFGRREVSSLAKTILIGLPHGKTIVEISKEIGIDESIVLENPDPQSWWVPD
jgi:hypothetical protein